jgi:hypothetical protein
MMKEMRSSQTIRDHTEVEDRRRRAGALFEAMECQLDDLTKKELVARACEISQKTGCPKPDRLCRRQRIGIICWFCKYGANYETDRPKVGRIVRQARLVIPQPVQLPDIWIFPDDAELGSLGDTEADWFWDAANW